MAIVSMSSSPGPIPPPPTTLPPPECPLLPLLRTSIRVLLLLDDDVLIVDDGDWDDDAGDEPLTDDEDDCLAAVAMTHVRYAQKICMLYLAWAVCVFKHMRQRQLFPSSIPRGDRRFDIYYVYKYVLTGLDRRRRR